MLEKLVLLVVSLFSVATEMRLEQKQSQFSSILSEPWHAQSVIYASYYLPKDCPLVDHLIDTYFKHYQQYHILALTKSHPHLQPQQLTTEETVATEPALDEPQQQTRLSLLPSFKTRLSI